MLRIQKLQDAKKAKKMLKFIGTNSSFQNFTPLETVWKYNAAGY
jgi:hypothetical protein